MKAVLLEGCDGGGKSRLAETLLEEPGSHLVHMSIPDERPIDYWWKRLEGAPTDGTLVIDRLHWSEDVYGPLFRGGADLTQGEREDLEAWLTERQCVVVLCLPPYEVAMRNVAKAEGDKHHEPMQAMLVWLKYAEPWETTLPVVAYDYTVDSLPDIGRARKEAYG